MFDVAIVGAGPAGATLAKLISSKLNILLLDKRQLDFSKEISLNHRDKCCGGLLAPDAQKIMGELGMGLPRHILVDPQLFAVRTIDLANGLENYYQRFYINMDRERFDRWLVSLIPEKVDQRFGAVLKNVQKQKDHLLLHFNQDGKEYTEKARSLIGADGAASKVRKLCFPEHTFPVSSLYIAIQEWIQNQTLPPYFSVIFDPSITNFYSWTIPKNDVMIIGSALPVGKTASQKFALLKEKLIAHGFHLDKTIKREAGLIIRPLHLRSICTGKDNIALIGEAAGFISPSSAEGLSYAFTSAELIAQALQQTKHPFIRAYNKAAFKLKRNIVLKSCKSPFMYNPLLRKTVMLSRYKSLAVKRGELFTELHP